jgi:hypothetical protein
MVANNGVHISIVELVETTEDKHHQEQIMSEDFPFYPSYKEGETLFLRTTVKGKPDENKSLTQYVIVYVHHSIHQHISPTSSFAKCTSFINVEVYIRKVN